MAEAPTSTCQPWAVLADLCAPCVDTEMTEAELEAGIQMASDSLFHLTGRRFPGVCTDTVRPRCGCSGDPCGGVSQVVLPGYPVVSITEVVIDGVPVDAARYRIDNYRWLTYVRDPGGSSGRGRWPCTQLVNEAPTEVGTWEVTYTYGQAPPAAGVRHAATLGCQLALLCSSDPDLQAQCRIPKRATQVNRQGVTVTLDPVAAMLANGATGLPDVDGWLAALRYGDKHRRATAFVPGRRAAARRDTT